MKWSPHRKMEGKEGTDGGQKLMATEGGSDKGKS